MGRFASRKSARESGLRPKALPLHTNTVAGLRDQSTTQKSDSGVTDSSHEDTGRDSANFKAAQILLQKRLDAGLTQEELAFMQGESPRQVIRRERGEVWLGPLRSLVVLERAAALKAKK